MKLAFGDKEFEAVFNGFTPIVFSRNFHVDMLDGDGKPTGRRRPKDINEDVDLIVETMRACGMPSMTALLEICYACIKNAKPRWSSTFKDWARSLPPEAFDLQNGEGWAADVMKIVEDNFFHSASHGVEAAPAEETSATAAG